MGRYYNGDIEGKFMFAVQSSHAADRFGCTGFNNYVTYYFDESHLDTIYEELAMMQEAYLLGVQIRDCIIENEYCEFEAEL